MTLYMYRYLFRHIHYITFSLTCGLRTVYLINVKNFICVDIVKCQVKFCLLLNFLHIYLFLTNLAGTGGPHEISRRAACSPRVGQHCITQSTCNVNVTGHFYSTSASPLPLRGAPNYSTDTVSEFHAEAPQATLSG